MDAIDKKIINQIQTNFPLVSRPYAEVAKRLGLTEEEVISRVKRLKKEGYIRRIGANFNSDKLGFASTLCGAKVPPDKIEDFVKVVNSYKEVTHNYQRRDSFNIWFTFIAPTMADIEKAIEDIKRQTGVKEIYNLPAIKTFKINVKFNLD